MIGIRKTREEFIRDSENIHGKGKIDYSKVNYINNKTKVTLICLKHQCEYYIRPYCHLGLKQFGCPECKRETLGNLYRKSKEKFIEEVEEIYGEGRFNFSETNYITEKIPVRIYSNRINKETGEPFGFFTIKPENLLYGRFNENSISSGEAKVEQFLVKSGLTYSPHFLVKGELSEKAGEKFLLIDFQVLYNDKIFWIEYQGMQHYQYIKHFHKNLKKFYKRLKRDSLVRDYCKDNGIILIEIPYSYKNQSDIDTILQEIIINGNLNYKIDIPEIQTINKGGGT
jgi:hypothetical protein